MTQQVMSKSAFARLAGVSPAAITKALGKQLTNAKAGKYIDAAHPQAVAYLKGKGVDRIKPDTTKPQGRPKKAGTAKPKGPKGKPGPAAAKKPATKKDNPEKQPEPIDLVPAHIREYADMTLRELVIMFGTDVGFKAWLEASVKIEKLKTEQIKNAKNLKDLVKWSVVEKAFITPVNELFVKLLTDCVESVTGQCMTSAKAGETKESCEKLVREKIESFLLQLKKQWKRNRANYV